jgi:hypothetical protein
MKHKNLFTFGLVMLLVWVFGAFAFLYFYPQITYNGLKKLITQKGVDANTSSGVPINTLYAVPVLAAPSAPVALILNTGNHETLYVLGWLDLSKGPLVLHVPDMNGRYYSVQFTDPTDGADFAYVGTRATGTQVGDFLITGPGWQGSVPQGMKQVSSPDNSVLVLGRALVESDSDVATVYALTNQIQLTPLSQLKPWQ